MEEEFEEEFVSDSSKTEEPHQPSETTELSTASHIQTRQNTQNIFRRNIRENPRKQLIARHRHWLDSIQHEYPMPYVPYKIGVYIRYYNQTKYEDYLQKHIDQFSDDIALCPNWTLVDFYIDKGMNAPRMENAKEWCRLLDDCLRGKVDLIVTQKVSNVSNDPEELTLVMRLLATQKHPIGIYFVSEDMFSLASYYRRDMQDRDILPPNWQCLPEDELDRQLLGYSDYSDSAASEDEGDNHG